MSPELATALALFAVIVALAVLVRGLRDRSARRRARAREAAAKAVFAASAAEIVDPPPDARGVPARPARIVVAGDWRANVSRPVPPPDVPEEPPRVQLVRDAAAVGIAIIVVLLVGPTIFASRTGMVLGETFAPDDGAVAPLVDGPSPAAEAPPDGTPRDGEAIPSLSVPVAPAATPAPTPRPADPATPGPRPTPDSGNPDPTPTPRPAPTATPKPSPTPKPTATPTPTPTPAPTPTPTPEPTPAPTPTPAPEPTPTPPPEESPGP